jgi:hypothetical protein
VLAATLSVPPSSSAFVIRNSEVRASLPPSPCLDTTVRRCVWLPSPMPSGAHCPAGRPEESHGGDGALTGLAWPPPPLSDT